MTYPYAIHRRNPAGGRTLVTVNQRDRDYPRTDVYDRFARYMGRETYGEFNTPHYLIIMRPVGRKAKKEGVIKFHYMNHLADVVRRTRMGTDRSTRVRRQQAMEMIRYYRGIIRRSLRVHEGRGRLGARQVFIHRRALNHPVFFED